MHRLAPASSLGRSCRTVLDLRGHAHNVTSRMNVLSGNNFLSLQSRSQMRLPSRQDLAKLKLKELQILALEHRIPTAGCFEKEDLVHRLALVSDAQSSSTTSHASQSSSANSAESLRNKSIRELQALIAEAGLSSQGLLEKQELIARAREAKTIIDERAQRKTKRDPQPSKAKSNAQSHFSDAVKYRDLDVVLYARGRCPYCDAAVVALQRRGLKEFAMQDVEWSLEAAKELRRLGGTGVPFFYSRKTGKSVSGWNEGQETLDWLVRRLS